MTSTILILFLVAVSFSFIITFARPRLVLVCVLVASVFIPSGMVVPVPGLRNFGLAQLLFPYMLLASFFLLNRRETSYKLWSGNTILMVALGFWHVLVVLVQSYFSAGSIWRAAITLPWYFIWIPAIALIEDKRGFKVFIWVLISHCFIISLFALIEFFTDFNLFLYYHADNQNVTQIERFGFVRGSGGMFAHPVPAAVYLVLTMPFCITWFGKRTFAFITFFLALFAMFFFQARAAIFGFLIAYIVVFFLSGQFRLDMFRVRKIVAALVFVCFVSAYGVARDYGDMLAKSVDFDRKESENFTTRYPDFFDALEFSTEIPFWGWGMDTEYTTTRYRLVNEQPWFIDLMYKGGMVFGLLGELYLIIGIIYLVRLLIRRSPIPLPLRTAALVGFLSHGIAMHINRDSYGLFMSMFLLAGMEVAHRHFSALDETDVCRLE